LECKRRSSFTINARADDFLSHIIRDIALHIRIAKIVAAITPSFMPIVCPQ
jgi:hypothetical protein